MAITGGDWASATDPFVMALDASYTGASFDYGNNKVSFTTFDALVDGIVEERDLQEAFWSKDGDPDKTFSVDAILAGVLTRDDEFGKNYVYNGSSFDTYTFRNLANGAAHGATIYFGSKASGAVFYSLYVYAAYFWADKDPAQILFSWITYYCGSPAVSTLKTYLNQTSFQDASDFYDDIGMQITCPRDVGTKVADQVKTLMDQCHDFLAIRPDPADGECEMFFLNRRNLADRTTAIALESNSVTQYTVRPTDKYTMDGIDSEYGQVVSRDVSATTQYNTNRPPTQLPSTSRFIMSQRAGALTDLNTVSVECPYHLYRGAVAETLDLNFWHLPQDEIEMEFSNWSHLNFEVGDVVHFTGRGYDGTEDFVCTEKELDLDSMLATARFIQLRGIKGKSPRLTDLANLLFNITPNQLGYYVDGTQTFPIDVALNDDTMNLDRVWDHADNYAHGTQINRGTGGPAGANPSVPKMVMDQVNRWPVLRFDGEAGLMQISDNINYPGFNVPVTAAVSDFTFYAVVNVTSIVTQALWSFERLGLRFDFGLANSGGNVYPYFYDGGGAAERRGTTPLAMGWQILTFVCEDPASGLIRVDGATTDSGLSYTAIALTTPATSNFYSIGCFHNGNTWLFDGDIAEIALFETAHTATEWDEIEAYFAEKYDITI